jgi:hypothetical protein
MARARDIANIINSGTFLTPASASATYASINSTGLVPILRQTFTSSSEVVPNSSVFTSTYQNYKILINIDSVSTSTIIRMRLRTGSTNETSANYRGSGIRWNSGGAAFSGGNSQTSIAFYNDASNDARYVQMELRKPYQQEFKQYHLWSSDNSVNSYENVGQLILSSSYDKFAIIPDSGNITGSFQIFGYKEI